MKNFKECRFARQLISQHPILKLISKMIKIENPLRPSVQEVRTQFNRYRQAALINMTGPAITDINNIVIGYIQGLFKARCQIFHINLNNIN